MLTAAELKQVKDYLAQYGKKDSQLPSARTPLTGQEQISIVQDGQSKIAPFSEILEQMDYPLDKDILTYAEYIALPVKSTQTLYIITDDGTATGNVVQIFLGELPLREAGNNSIRLSASPSVVFLNGSTNVTLTATASRDADSIVIKEGESTIAEATFVPSLQATVEVNTSTQFKVFAAMLGYSYQDSVNVTAINPIYYGSGSGLDDFWANKVQYQNATTTPARAYDVTVRANGDYVYFAVPNSMTIHSATLSGFDFPLDSTVDTSKPGYKIYKSANTYVVDTLNIVIV